MRLFGIEVSHMRQDYLAHYCIWLSELQIPQVCDGIRNQLLMPLRDERFAYSHYFTEQKIAAWTNHKKNQETSMIEKIPSKVIVLYDIMDTLQSISNTFKDIESIDLRDQVSTITIVRNAITILSKDFPIVYSRLQNLNHSSVGIDLMITPLLNQLYSILGKANSIKNDAITLTDRVATANQEALGNLLPTDVKGLAFFSRSIILSSFLLKELTELIERGDLKIDFDPTSPEILKLESRFNREFQQIQNANALLNGLGPMGRLAKLLYGEISKILNESIPLTQAAHTRAKDAYQTIQDSILADYRVEVELLEEHLSLEPGTLTEQFEIVRTRFLHQLSKYVTKLDALPAQTERLAQMSEQPANAIAAATISTVQGGVRKVTAGLNKMIPTLHQRRRRRIRINDALQRQEEEAIEPITSEIYSKTVQKERLMRLAQHHAKATDESAEISAHDFFYIIEQYNQQSGEKQIQMLPEKTKLALKRAYITLQPYFARKYPKLDQDIVNGLNGAHTAPKPEVHAVSPLDRKAISTLGSVGSILTPWNYTAASLLLASVFGSYSTTVLNMASVGIVAVYAAGNYLANQSNNELQRILNCKDEVLIEIRQEKAEALFKCQLIEKQFEKDLHLSGTLLKQNLTTRAEYVEQLETYRELKALSARSLIEKIKQPLSPLGDRLENKTLFARLKQLQYSKTISRFEQTTLIPTLKELLNERELNNLINDDNTPKAPFSEFYKDNEQIIVYKKLLNAFYHLKTCLSALEKVDDLGEPSSWNIYGQVVVARDALVPILTDGINAYFDIVETAKNPQVFDIAQLCLSQLQGLDNLLPMLSGFTHILNNVPQDTPPFNAKEAWLHQQAHYESLLNKTVLPITEVVPIPLDEDSIQEEPPIAPEDNIDVTIHSISLWISKHALRFKTAHASLLNKEDTPIDEEVIARDAMISANQFFELLSLRIHQHLYNGEDALRDKSLQLVQQLKELSLVSGASSASNATSLWTLFDDIKKTLGMLDQIGDVIKDTYSHHTEDVLDNIKFLHDIIGFKLLTSTADAEFKLGLKTGILSKPVSQYLDGFFENLLRKYSTKSEYLLEYWSDNILLDLRVHHEKSQVSALRLQALIENDQVPHNISATFRALDTLKSTFPKDTSTDFESIQAFDEFLRHYEVLQPLLAQVDKKYDQSTFLKGLHNHRPDLVISAIQEIIHQAPKILTLYASREQHHQHNIEDRLKRVEHLNQVERLEREALILQKTMHQILTDKYADLLGDYTPLLIKVVENDIQQDLPTNPLLPILKNYLQCKNSDGETVSTKQSSPEFRRCFEHYIATLIETNESTTGVFLNTLTKINSFDKRIEKQTQKAWRNTYQEFNFCLKPLDTEFVAQANKLYFEYEHNKLYYSVIDPQGILVRAEIEADFLLEHHIDLSTGLTDTVIEKQLLPKSLPILAMTTARSHTQVNNPCLTEKMAYLQIMNGSQHKIQDITQKLEALIDADHPERIYKKLYLEESRRLRILWRVRERKLEKYDLLITAFDNLNALESKFKHERSTHSQDKIDLVRALKDILKDSSLTPQKRLDILALNLSAYENRQLLSLDTTHTLEWLVPSFLRWKKKEDELLSRLYDPMWQGVKILLILNDMEKYLLSNQPDGAISNQDKLIEIRTLRAILQSLDKPHIRVEKEFLAHLSSARCKDILSRNSDGYFTRLVKLLYSKLTGWVRTEDKLLSQLQTQSTFFKPPVSFQATVHHAVRENSHESALSHTDVEAPDRSEP